MVHDLVGFGGLNGLEIKNVEYDLSFKYSLNFVKFNKLSRIRAFILQLYLADISTK